MRTSLVTLWKLAKRSERVCTATDPAGYRVDWWDDRLDPPYCAKSEFFTTLAAARNRAQPIPFEKPV